jgi:pimeloyl-ACP methyl ester carboxylesterase
MSWKLDENVQTSAGMVAAGRLGSGPALVLAHGWPWSSFSWHRIIPDLASRYRVHLYDMPGYGRSNKSAEQRMSLDVQGNIFAEMLSHWGLVRPMVVAHDMGGAATLWAHLLQGCEFDRYVLMNVVRCAPGESEFFDHVGRHVDAFLDLPPHIHRAVAEAYIKGAIVNEIESRDFEKLVEPWLSEEGQQSFYRQFARKIHRGSRTDVRRYSLSILDEAQLAQHYGVLPDIVTFGKGLSAGLPICGAITTSEIAEEIRGRCGLPWAGTYTGDPFPGCNRSKAIADHHTRQAR